MTGRGFYFLGALVLFALGGVFFWKVSTSDGSQQIDYPIDLAKGQALYAKSCAACHGKDLEGQPDWQSPGSDGRLPAPPHDETGHTWHHPDSLLFKYTKLGGQKTLAEDGMEFDSGMPGFGNQLNDEEIWNIVAFIKSTWSDRIRQIQAERSAADQKSRGG